MSALVPPVSSEQGGVSSFITLGFTDSLGVDSLVRVGHVVLGEPTWTSNTASTLSYALTTFVGVASNDGRREWNLSATRTWSAGRGGTREAFGCTSALPGNGVTQVVEISSSFVVQISGITGVSALLPPVSSEVGHVGTSISLILADLVGVNPLVGLTLVDLRVPALGRSAFSTSADTLVTCTAHYTLRQWSFAIDR